MKAATLSLLVKGGCDAATTAMELSSHSNTPHHVVSKLENGISDAGDRMQKAMDSLQVQQTTSLLTHISHMAAQLGMRTPGHLENVFLLIILCEQHLVHDRGLPFGALVGHWGGLVQVVRQGVASPHGQHVLGVGGADFVDEDLTILNGLTHSTQAV